MIELDVENGSLKFKRQISIDEFSKAMLYFNKMHKLLFGKDASYKDFTAFLATSDAVELTPGIKVKKK